MAAPETALADMLPSPSLRPAGAPHARPLLTLASLEAARQLSEQEGNSFFRQAFRILH